MSGLSKEQLEMLKPGSTARPEIPEGMFAPMAGPMPESLPDTGGENGEAFQNMAAYIWAAGASLEDADFITRMLARKGLYLFETKPWERCPSTHCERRGECCSPRDCTIKSPARP